MEDCECVNQNYQGLGALGGNGCKRLMNVFGIGHLEVASSNS